MPAQYPGAARPAISLENFAALGKTKGRPTHVGGHDSRHGSRQGYAPPAGCGMRRPSCMRLAAHSYRQGANIIDACVRKC